eukprot:Plantae.Rhodophyta-Purpureofilum_apyrenoidigerum.ctg7105.p1 GENE.Plantae.Rhodophyta-Purpureofilum_apyrenoidigerum.ctg7105~~Plantae.Rhodophyta-Purpureofilum_apyrenoidigerum.ctg7105.p1  ORF type:complete len:261 (+),score=45.35 Plantae.Rhodophyta-Purpureofilum_apyrenoidigerum.ctg7105:41-823(+)
MMENLSSATSYLNVPTRSLNSTEDAPLMSDVNPYGQRTKNGRRRSVVLPRQEYFIRNNHTVLERGENTVYAPVEGATTLKETVPVYDLKIVRNGSIIGYKLRERATERELLKIHVHANTKSRLSKIFTGLVNNPLNKYDVENYGLYSDLANGHKLGVIEEVFPDNRVFNPTGGISPRLEMQFTRSLGQHYWLAVTGISEPIGEVTSDVLGRFAPRSEAYKLILRNCTKEEGLLWLMMVIATDMKRRKTSNVRYRGGFVGL